MSFSGNRKRDLKSLLPKHQVGDELWNKIEGQLKIDEVMPELPKYEAREGLWFKIASNLDTADRVRNRSRTIRMVSYVASLAASLILVLLISGTFNSKGTAPNSVVVHSVEVVENQPVIVFASQQTLPDSERINAYCSNFPTVCDDPEFAQLKSKWTRLKKELDNLKAMSGTTGAEQVNHYIARIEMDIKQIEDKMMLKFL